MIAPKHAPDSKKPQPPPGLLQLRVDLMDSDPKIWRRLIVPADANLAWLHAVLQISMGWTNSHLHQFKSGDRLISDPKFGLDSAADGSPMLDEGKVKLSEVLKRLKSKLLYEYDFGDSWTHLITLEARLSSLEAIPEKAVCLEGERACPPEDCGGVFGFANLLEVLKDRKHPDHDDMKEWLGGGFKEERFSAKETTGWLGKLPWPRVTEAALGKVLQARFGMEG